MTLFSAEESLINNMDIIEEVKSFVEEECKKPESKYGYEPFVFHFASVAKYAEELAEQLGADKEVVVISSWLHDIGSIVHGRKDHHITGAEIAVTKLRELRYPEDRIEMVKKCILNHRGSQDNTAISIEERIVSDADALSNFDNIPGIFKAAFFFEHLTQGEAKDSVRQKLENKWKKLYFENSREIIRPKYEAAMLILK